MKQIIIISSAESDTNLAILKDFSENIQSALQNQAEVTVVHYNNLVFHLAAQATVTDVKSGKNILATDLVYMKSFVRYEEEAVALAHLLQHANRPFFCSELLSSMSMTKLTQYARLWIAGLPLPRTMYLNKQHLASSFSLLQATLGEKFIVKAIDGKGGEDNFLVYDVSKLSDIQQNSADLQFVCQEFIPNSYDLRVLIANKKIRLVIKRQRADDSTHLNNTSQGAHAELMPVSELAQTDAELSLKAAEVLQRELAGVDLMYENSTGKPYILEVNAGPQVGSGAFVEEKQHMFEEMFVELLNI